MGSLRCDWPLSLAAACCTHLRRQAPRSPIDLMQRRRPVAPAFKTHAPPLPNEFGHSSKDNLIAPKAPLQKKWTRPRGLSVHAN